MVYFGNSYYVGKYLWSFDTFKPLIPLNINKRILCKLSVSKMKKLPN
jgi:hypothetical protein